MQERAHIQKVEKVKVSHSHKSDNTLLQQQIDDAILQTLAQLQKQSLSDPQPQHQPSQEFQSQFEQHKPVIQRRLNQYFIGMMSRMRGLLEYDRVDDHEVETVVMEPDINLQKINNVKMEMLREAILKAEREQWPQCDMEIKVSQPQKLEVVHFQGFKTDIVDSLHKNHDKVADMSKQIQKIRDLENLVKQSLEKIQNQQLIDSEYYQNIMQQRSINSQDYSNFGKK